MSETGASLEMVQAYVGLGSNLGQPDRQVRDALVAIAATPGVSLLRQSSLYRSAPMGPPGQPDYCNAACVVDTELSAAALMAQLLRIEREAGRVRGGDRWGPRRLDLDLLHMNGVALEQPELRLPHPGIGQRNFVLVPLAEAAPELVIPGLGSIALLAAQAGQHDLSLW